jgi:peptide-methionine (S)-S-oxide reductase
MSPLPLAHLVLLLTVGLVPAADPPPAAVGTEAAAARADTPKDAPEPPKGEPKAEGEPKGADDAAKAKPELETAVLGGGCFWCLDAVYRRVVGVKDVISGFAGGHTSKATYKMVLTGATGHAEVVQVVYDPSVVTYDRLLEIFWHIHDPTTLNRQGPDIGTQYRSIILVKNQEQAEAAQKSLLAAQKEFPAPIVTQIAPLTKFFKAEAYHQDFYRKNKFNPYCRAYIAPKLQKLGVRP